MWKMYFFDNFKIFTFPKAKEVVVHSPTPSKVRTAALSNGDG
jgi:hypothetical protein